MSERTVRGVEVTLARDGHAQSIPSATLLWYALPAAPISFQYALLLIVYASYATDVLGAAPAVLGAVFLVSRAWDAVSDPIVGYLSDRTRLRLGRRKP